MKNDLKKLIIESTLDSLKSFFKIHHVDSKEVILQIEKLSYDSPGGKNMTYHIENLLHKRHFTNGRYGTWKGFLDDKYLEQITNKYRDWFIENNYQL
jgi:hypothetical protein